METGGPVLSKIRDVKYDVSTTDDAGTTATKATTLAGINAGLS